MPGLRWRALHVLALTALSITQPLLGLLGDNPTFFTAHDASPGRIVWFALVVALGPAAVVAGVVIVAALIDRSVGERVHLVVLFVLAFVFLIQVVDLVPGPWVVPVGLAAAGAGGFVAVYLRHRAVRTTVSVLGVTPVLAVGLFLFASPTSDLVFPDDVEAVELGDLVDAEELAEPTAADDEAPLTVAERLARRFPDIHLLILDELPMATLLGPDGRIDRDRFPNFARLADTADLFTNATTIGLTTERAVPAILTGSYESADAPVYSRYPANLYTLLGDIYDATESDPLVHLCPPSICNGEPPASISELLETEAAAPSSTSTSTSTPPATPPVPDTDDERVSFGRLLADARIVFGHLVAPDGLDLGLPDIGGTWGDFGVDFAATPTTTTTTTVTTTSSTTTTAPAFDFDLGQIPDDPDLVDAEEIGAQNTAFLDSLITNDTRLTDFATALAGLEHGGAPRLTVIHTLLPHVPWRLHADGRTYADIHLPGYFSRWDDDSEIARAGMQRHLLQTVATDRLLGAYLDRLDEIGAFDESLVIVTADHGIRFDPGERSRGPGTPTAGIANVPLLVKRPGQQDGTRVDVAVETVDIVPTIADLLDIEIPWSVDGRPLSEPDADRFREVRHPFTLEVPEPLPPARDAITAEIHAVFGTGSDGSLYARAGLHERIGSAVDDLLGEPASACWNMERPTAIPEADGATGFVFGAVRSTRTEPIPIALTVDGVLAGTSTTLRHEVAHRVYALGDPAVFDGASLDHVALAEIDDGVLRPIRRC